MDHVTFDVLLKVDDVTSLDITSDSRVRQLFCSCLQKLLQICSFSTWSVWCLFFFLQVIAFSQSRVTTVMAVGEELWVGLGNGQVLIFDVIRNDAYEDEAYVLLDKNKGNYCFVSRYRWRGGLMVCALDSSSPGSSTGRRCVMSLDKTLYLYCLSPPRWINGYWRIDAGAGWGGTMRWNSIRTRGE